MRNLVILIVVYVCVCVWAIKPTSAFNPADPHISDLMTYQNVPVACRIYALDLYAPRRDREPRLNVFMTVFYSPSTQCAPAVIGLKSTF